MDTNLRLMHQIGRNPIQNLGDRPLVESDVSEVVKNPISQAELQQIDPIVGPKVAATLLEAEELMMSPFQKFNKQTGTMNVLESGKNDQGTLNMVWKMDPDDVDVMTTLFQALTKKKHNNIVNPPKKVVAETNTSSTNPRNLAQELASNLLNRRKKLRPSYRDPSNDTRSIRLRKDKSDIPMETISKSGFRGTGVDSERLTLMDAKKKPFQLQYTGPRKLLNQEITQRMKRKDLGLRKSPSPKKRKEPITPDPVIRKLSKEFGIELKPISPAQLSPSERQKALEKKKKAIAEFAKITVPKISPKKTFISPETGQKFKKKVRKIVEKAKTVIAQKDEKIKAKDKKIKALERQLTPIKRKTIPHALPKRTMTTKKKQPKTTTKKKTKMRKTKSAKQLLQVAQIPQLTSAQLAKKIKQMHQGITTRSRTRRKTTLGGGRGRGH